MSVYTIHHPHVAHGSESHNATLFEKIREGKEILSHWYLRSRARRRLVDLDDRILDDIGLSRFEAEREYRKFFWQD